MEYREFWDYDKGRSKFPGLNQAFTNCSGFRIFKEKMPNLGKTKFPDIEFRYRIHATLWGKGHREGELIFRYLAIVNTRTLQNRKDMRDLSSIIKTYIDSGNLKEP